MNVRILVAVVVAALILSVIELSCVAHERMSTPTTTKPSLFTEAPEPELPVAVDTDGLASPILTR
jgi:hypothetical protein